MNTKLKLKQLDARILVGRKLFGVGVTSLLPLITPIYVPTVVIQVH